MEQEYIGRYRIIGRLGKGGMGTVVRAFDEVRQREVAIKLPADTDPDVIRRLQRECDVLGQLQHQSIVQVYGSGNDPNVPFYIVMEYVEGTTIEELLKRQGGSLEWRRAVQIALSVAEALAYAHRPPLRIVHRDIKPANVMIRASDNAVKVTDFGIAAVLSEHTGGKTAIGTMAYMAPEQAMGTGVDERTDLYSLGAMLYEMLAGQRPPQLASNQARPPSGWLGSIAPPEVCRRLDRLTLGLLQREPGRRFPQRAGDVVEELRALLEGRPSSLPANAPAILDAPTQRGSLSGAQAGTSYQTYEQVSGTVRSPSSTSYPPPSTGYPLPSAGYPPPSQPPYSGPPPVSYPSQPPLVYPTSAYPPAPVQVVMPQPVYQVVQVVPPTPAPPFTHFAGFSLAAGIFALVISLCPVLLIIVNLSAPNTKGAIDPATFWIFVGLNVPALLAVLLGHIAQLRIRLSRKGLTGIGTATTGLCFGYFCLIVTIIAYFVHRG
jgi:serine/threonine protein kinase